MFMGCLARGARRRPCLDALSGTTGCCVDATAGGMSRASGHCSCDEPTAVNPLRAFGRAVFDSAHVLRSRHKAGRKARILLAYWRLTSKRVTFPRLFPPSPSPFGGFRAKPLATEPLHSFFGEFFSPARTGSIPQS